MGIAENIKARREQIGMKVPQLAEILGVAKSTIYRYESGDIENVNSEILEPLAAALRTTPAALMGWGEATEKIKDITPNLERAALKAMETLRDNGASAAPVLALPILKTMSNVFIVSFTEHATETGIDIPEADFGSQSQDVVSVINEAGGIKRHLVAYNQRLPFYMLQFALARELGHIVLDHNDTTPDDVRMTEALYFARYLLCPRPLIRAMQDRGISLTIETVGNITGCYGRSLAGIRKTPGAHIPAELNRQVRSQFDDYVSRFLDCQRLLPNDKSANAEFGSYMNNYME